MSLPNSDLFRIDRGIHLQVASRRTTAAITRVTTLDLAQMPVDVARKVIAVLSSAEILAEHTREVA